MLPQKNYEEIVFGGGCFWCTEAVFLQLKGVIQVTSGYAGGDPPAGGENPTYEKVSTGRTGHAEVIKIKYDPEILSFRQLLEVFFSAHDPTQLNGQGNDIGPQYRSIILYTTGDQKAEAEKYIRELTTLKKYKNPIKTELRPLKEFYRAEDYHQDYFARNPAQPYSQAVIQPKVDKLKNEHSELLKDF